MVGPWGISREAHSLTLISQVSQQDCLNADNEHRIPGLEKPCTIVNLTHLKGESSITVNSLTLCPARKCFAAGAARFLRALSVKTVFQDHSLDAGAQAQACLAFLSSALLQDALQGAWTGGLQHRPCLLYTSKNTQHRGWPVLMKDPVNHEVQPARTFIMLRLFTSVIPAKAEIQEISSRAFWIPTFAGMTNQLCLVANQVKG